MRAPLRHRNLWTACGMGFVALVIYLSLTPNPIDAPQWDGYKTGHILAYAWLMFWFALVFGSRAQRFGIAAVLILMGVALEFVQGLTGYRHFAYADMVDDAIGVGVGLVLATTPLGGALGVVESWLRKSNLP